MLIQSVAEGRALGDTLVVVGLCDEIEYDNRDAKGGALAPTYYAEKYAQDPDALLIADTSLVGALALHAPAVDLSRFNPVARLTSDYLVVVVPADSPISSGRSTSTTSLSRGTVSSSSAVSSASLQPGSVISTGTASA